MIAELALDNKAFSEYGVNFATKALLMVKKGTDISWDLPMYSGSFGISQMKKENVTFSCTG